VDASVRTARSRSRNPDVAMAAILEAATEEFARFGFKGARLEQIASRAGYDKRLISHYYGSKQKLYEDVISLHLNRLDKVVRAIPRDKAADASIAEFVETYMAFLAENIAHTWLVFQEEVEKIHTGRSRGRAMRSELFNVLSGIILTGQEMGEFRSDVDPERAVVTILGMCFHPFALRDSLSDFVNPWIDNSDGFDAHVRHVTEFALAALST
jgi:TetR/AcrR family transcriptional regulator